MVDAQGARPLSNINVLEHEEGEQAILNTAEKVKVKVAVDSGAVDNVIHPKELPADARPQPNTIGKHFAGPKGEQVEKFGSCDTRLETEHGAVGCHWQLADVTRPPHSVSKAPFARVTIRWRMFSPTLPPGRTSWVSLI